MYAIVKFTSLSLAVLAVVLPTSVTAAGQHEARRLRSPATVRGVIGGESHDSYVVRARAGQTISVSISWQHELNALGDQRAEFFMSESSEFDGDAEVKFGKTSSDGKHWSGTAPKTGNYYIYVTAYPTAHYTLRVTVK